MSAAYEKKIEQLKSHLEESRHKVADERKKWQETLNVLDAKLATTKDQVYNEKMKRRNVVQQQIDETKCIESDLHNYTECLEEKNVYLCRELKDAIIAKHAAAQSSRRDKHLAKSRLDKWNKEQCLRQIAEDYAAKQEKRANKMASIIKDYESVIKQSEESKQLLKKEWCGQDGRRGVVGGGQFGLCNSFVRCW